MTGYLSFIAAIEISSAIDIDHTFLNIMVSILIFAPIPLLFYYIYSLYQQLRFQQNDPKKYDDLHPKLAGTEIKIAPDSNEGNHHKTNTEDVADMITNMVTAHELGVAIPADIDGDDDFSSSDGDSDSDDKQDSILNGNTVRTEIEMIANVDIELSEVP